MKISPVGPPGVKGLDTKGRRGRRHAASRLGGPTVERLAAARRVATGQPPPPRPGTVDAGPRDHTGRQEGKRISAALQGECRGTMTAPHAARKMTQRRLSEEGGREARRKRGQRGGGAGAGGLGERGRQRGRRRGQHIVAEERQWPFGGPPRAGGVVAEKRPEGRAAHGDAGRECGWRDARPRSSVCQSAVVGRPGTRGAQP